MFHVEVFGDLGPRALVFWVIVVRPRSDESEMKPTALGREITFIDLDVRRRKPATFTFRQK